MTVSNDVRVVGISLGCPDPGRLADFYLDLLGGTRLWVKESSVGIRVAGAVLVAQRVASHKPPNWPADSVVHLDLTAEDIDKAEERAVMLGATRAIQPDRRWRVLLDPAGHPFCLTPFTPDGIS